MITDEQLKKIVPSSYLNDRYNFLTELNKIPARYGITNAVLPSYIAQIAHESGYFHYLIEYGGINYFKKYDNRKDLGNTHPGDGYKYRGMGYIMVTGLYNYTKFKEWLQSEIKSHPEIKEWIGDEIDVVEHPELVGKPHLGMVAALWFWTTHGLNKFAITGDFKGLTRKINPGLLGYADRLTMYNKAKEILK